MKDELEHILSTHSRERTELVSILREIQETFGYLPEEALLEVAEFLRLPPAKIWGVATFYNEFIVVP